MIKIHSGWKILSGRVYLYLLPLLACGAFPSVGWNLVGLCHHQYQNTSC